MGINSVKCKYSRPGFEVEDFLSWLLLYNEDFHNTSLNKSSV